MQGKNAEKPIKPSRRLAGVQKYVSPNQLVLDGFETPFQQHLTSNNRWVKLSSLLPWDGIVNRYAKQFKSKEGRPPINGRVVVGAIIIKHMLNLTDRETIAQIQENPFMQFFLGYSTFTNEPPFDASLFVDIRERLSLAFLNEISELVIEHHIEKQSLKEEGACYSQKVDDEQGGVADNIEPKEEELEAVDSTLTHHGKLLMDATVAPQNITYPTDLKLLNEAREKTEEIIDELYDKTLHQVEKPRTYRNKARQEFLLTNKKKRKSYNEIRSANGAQLRYLKRNLNYIEKLLEPYQNDIAKSPVKKRLEGIYYTILTVYQQQNYMYQNRVNTVENRIVNLYQPHVRPIVRGKEAVKVEFGSKIQLALVDGFCYIDKLDWNNFNESLCLKGSVEEYKRRYGFYPREVHADKIYCTRENRKYLKELGITLIGKPLGRPSKEALSIQVSPGERNPVEGKFGQAKIAYGMNNIMAKLKTTSESWLGSIILVLNLVNLMRSIPLWIKLIAITISRICNKNFYFSQIKICGEFNS
jgi:IS5 family transposase